MDELFVKIQKLIAEKLEIDESKITMDSSFRGDLGADSLDTYELVYAIEEELEVVLGKKVDILFIGTRISDYFKEQLDKDKIRIC